MTGLNERKCKCGCGTVLNDNTHRESAKFATPACGRRYRRRLAQRKAGVKRRAVSSPRPGVSVYFRDPGDAEAMHEALQLAYLAGSVRERILAAVGGALERHKARAGK